MKRILALILVAILSVSILTSCSTKFNSDTLRVGVDNTYPPMEYQDKTGANVGFDIDLANEIGKRLNVKVELVPTAFDGIFNALNSKKYDCIISSISITEKRLKKYLFTKPYIANSQMIVVKPDNNSITKKEDLAGKIVGCQVSTTANESATKLQENGIKFKDLKTYNEIIQPFADMKAGRLDAIIVDEVVGQYYIAQDKTNFKAAAAKLTNEPIGICFKKRNKDLRDKVQKAIDDMVADGTMKTISIKWFGTDLTSNIDQVLKGL